MIWVPVYSGYFFGLEPCGPPLQFKWDFPRRLLSWARAVALMPLHAEHLEAAVFLRSLEGLGCGHGGLKISFCLPCSVPWLSSLVFCTLSGEGITCSLQRWGWRGHTASVSLSSVHFAGWNLVPVRPEGTCTESLGNIQLTTSSAS